MSDFYHNILSIITEDFEDDKRSATQMGFVFVDHQQVGGYDVSLFRMDDDGFNPLGEPFNQVGLNVIGASFLFDQHTKPEDRKQDYAQGFREVGNIIKGWLKKYDDELIIISSMIPKKTKIYKHLIDRKMTGIKTSEIKHDYGTYFELELD